MLGLVTEAIPLLQSRENVADRVDPRLSIHAMSDSHLHFIQSD